ncbi:anillin-like isoform X4 [Xenopus laevis]|uniref:Anillin n=1 Tax=Xenopus laevis TaxID=8355 RepID=A0A8J1MY34_XENLA|nr:anillin-like isoform X4 [Xenopus laevis]
MNTYQTLRNISFLSHSLKMETRRPPLKRLCPDSGNESPRKKRFTTLEDESENCDPKFSEGSEFVSRASWSSLLRIAEKEIKPDTPAIPSIRSRIQMLTDISKDVKQDPEGFSDGLGEKSWTDNLQDSSLFSEPEKRRETEEIKGHPDVRSVLEKFEWKPDFENNLPLPLAESTIARRSHHQCEEDEPSSEGTVRRLRKERDEELAMVCSMLDRKNPWRAESMRHSQKQNVDQLNTDYAKERRKRRRVKTGRGNVKMGPIHDTETDSGASDSGELSLEGSEGVLDNSDDRYISSLEVKLQSTLNSDSCDGGIPLQQEGTMSPSCNPQEAKDPNQGRIYSDDSEEVRGQVTMDNSAFIDRLFEGVLDSSNESAYELSERELDLPPVSLLSPLTKSIALQAAISPLNSVVSSLPELLVEPPVTPVPNTRDDSPLLYSIDAYRTMRRNAQGELALQTITKMNYLSPEKTLKAQVDGDSKEKIKLLSKEVSALQRIVEQACRALSCCVDAEHGKGTRQEAEAERLLLVSNEKRKALLKEIDRLRGESAEEPLSCPSSGNLKPCRGSVTVTDIRLPLKVDYVCSNIRESGYPSHYFLILIRFGSHDIVATPLASAADAQTGDTIPFPTTVTLKDISSDFKIDIEVYSLAQGGAITIMDKRKTLKPKLTPKKLLGSRKSSLNSPAYSPAVGNIVRSSNFLLVGSLTLSLDSLGKFKFPLEKMKLEGKLGRILGNHFQDKVPFLSPLEGNLYIKLQCQSHSTVQRSGFLTMFEDVSGLGAWHRRWCVLSLNQLSFWTYPDQEALKEPLSRINLANCTSAKIEPAKREVCARPNTLELITMRPQREDDTDTLVTQCRNTLCFTKNWLTADTKEERNQWMEALNQVLVDLRTWKCGSARVSPQKPLQSPNS